MTAGLPNRNTQHGAALAIGLILLAVAALVTLTTMNTGIMQERMTANHDNNARSFMAAEAGGAELIAWMNENGWPTTDEAPQLPGTVDGDQSMTYLLKLHPSSTSWVDSPLNVLIEGRSLSADDTNTTVLARTELLIQFEKGDPPPPVVNPPAAISCFNGPCSIAAGAGRGADEGFGTISGYNHPAPPLDCSGAGCRMQPQTEGDRTTPAVPAVYLQESVGSSVGVQGGGTFNAYQGLDPDGTGAIEGRNMDVAWTPSDYENVGAAVPTWESIFPDPPFDGHDPQTQLESGKDSLTEINGSDYEVGMVVVDGQDLTMQGNPLFVGVIVIRNCGTLGMGGNGNVYGAVIVDAVRTDGTACPPGYDPFGGNGTPAVRFRGPPGATGEGTGEDGSDGVKMWSEYLP